MGKCIELVFSSVFFLPGKKPQKPPRPTPPKPAGVRPTTESVATADEKVGTNILPTGAEEQSDSKSDLPKQADSSHACTRSVTVYWDIPSKPQPSAAPETTPASSDSSQRPVPLPRTKCQKKANAEEVEGQPLVTISENSDGDHADPGEVQSNEYLKELLEAFSTDNKWEESSDAADPSDEILEEGGDADGEMTSSHSQRNIRARIQAFESQAGSTEGTEPVKPEPLPRKPTSKPPVATKPSVALKPAFNHTTDDDDSQNVSVANTPQIPTPAPKPQPPKKPTATANRLSIKEELEALHSKGGVPNRSRSPGLTRANSIYEDAPPQLPPTPPVKPHKEPLKPNLNINNHNSTSVFRQKEYVDTPSE